MDSTHRSEEEDKEPEYSDTESEDEDDIMDDAEHERRMEQMRGRRTRDRRQVVFSEPVQLNEDFEPKVVPKTEEEKAEIRRVSGSPHFPHVSPYHWSLTTPWLRSCQRRCSSRPWMMSSCRS